jgi:hypothetical protein
MAKKSLPEAQVQLKLLRQLQFCFFSSLVSFT